MKKISKKISKKIIKIVQASVKESYYNQSVVKSDYNSNMHWCDYNEDVSNKIKSLILNIIKYKDNSNININLKDNSNININVGNVSNMKNSISTNGNTLSPESYLEINLIKDKGFYFSYYYNNQVYFKDDKIYDILYNIIISKYNELSMYKFYKYYKEILDLSGLNREYNLENLLDVE